MKNKYSWCLGVLLLSSISYGAPVRGKKIQPNSPTKKNTYSQNRNFESDYAPREIWNEKKFYLFGGIDLGLGSYAKSVVSTDTSRSGLAIGIRALAAYYTKKWVLDGGLGFSFISSSGTNTTSDILRVYTRTIFIDASARYRFNQNWQFGPELQYWLGTDNGLNANIFSSDKNNALMGGVQLIYEWMNDPNKYRIGARWNMDLNIADRNLNVFQLFFQIGFSPGGGSNEDDRPKYTEELKESDLEQAEPEILPAPEPEPVEVLPEPEPEVMSTPAPIEEPTPLPAGPQEKMVMTLDVNALPFETDSARLPKYNRDRVKEIGRFLGEQKDGWDRLIVSGHTDEQGKKAYNMKLSKARADTVRQLLGEGGAPISKIKTVGHGPNKPIDRAHHEKAWSKNRRVELEFIGVKDGLVIQKAFAR
jgi:outer membrane protein OmpA-like peptidoglycan-associated protein